MDILWGFDGILQVPSHGLQANHERVMDGYAGYDTLAELRRGGSAPLTLTYCWAHSRRKLHDICQMDGVEFHPEVTRGFHRELTRLRFVFYGFCWGQAIGGLPFRFGYC